jgi:hypothetical protein
MKCKVRSFVDRADGVRKKHGNINTDQHFLQGIALPLIRFFSSSKEFIQKVHSYKKFIHTKTFKHELYEELLNSYLNPK